MIEYNTNEIILDIDSLAPNPWNPNEESDFMQEKLGASLEKFGQVAEVLVRELPDGRYEIIDGEHRWKEMKAAGAEKILVNNLGKVTDSDAKLLTMAANELHGNRNPVKLAKILRDLEKEDDWKEIAAIMPYNEIEMSNLLDIDPDAEAPPEFGEPPEKGKDGKAIDGRAWVDIKVSVRREQYPEIERHLAEAKKTLGIATRPDKALERGEILKKLVITSG